MKRLLAMSLLLASAAIAQAATTSSVASDNELNAFKELQQSKWEAQKELQSKDIEAVRQQIAAVDKRVDDQLAQLGQSVDRFGMVISVLGIAITVLLVSVGLLGYRNAQSDAKQAATDAAKNSAEEWLKSNTTNLNAQIETLEKKAAQVHGQMDQTKQSVIEHEAKFKQEAEEASRTLQEHINKIGSVTAMNNDQSQALASRDSELKNINEDSYSFDDWNTRAFAAYSAGKLDDAAYFWAKASNVPNAGATNVAQVLFNRGISQAKLNQHEAEIATYDEVLRRFDEATEPALIEQVARALVNKGTAQGHLNQYEAAIATYDEVLRRFGEATEPALREQVARAANGAGFGRLLMAKTLGGPNEPAAQLLLQAALANLNDGAARCIQPNGMLLGNRAYVQCLLGNTTAAEGDFAAALRAPVNGGRELYEETLKDLDKHPLAEDANMRALVEHAWATYQSERA
ncbi:hypothetical protein [Rhodoferax sp. U11-2br]|uniref:hypothetical protein n=1 Tax=Rhodoferax sp. U11-2br TaxID=2838878 RepID=UPI001BEA4D18|nr:hypothetical protein [Rhodoferax sp. U11-2br]MBT3067285.1 hypothetical protein [Rhodoferax sp. U11-2br]